MNFRQASILTGLALTGLVGSSAFSPAQAVNLYRYTFSGGALSDNASLSGSFVVNLDGTDAATTYTDWNITTTQGAGNYTTNFTYTPSNSSVSQLPTFIRQPGNVLESFTLKQGFQLYVDDFEPNGFRYLYISFGTRDGSNVPTPQTLDGENVTLMRGFGTSVPSYETFDPTGLSTTGRRLTSSITATAEAVPFESGALPVVGASVLFGVGVWAKSKSKSKLAEKLLAK